MNTIRTRFYRLTRITLAAVLLLCVLSACTRDKIRLNPKNPVTVTVWHYYNGAIASAFGTLVKEFNETVGTDEGIIVEYSAVGDVYELEKAVMASVAGEVGSMDMPNIFASYADTAYEAEKMGLLANLDDYFTREEQSAYIGSFIEEGRIGLDGELRIFPIAKSTEALMVNETDWLPFSEECGFSYEDLSTMEGIARVAERYYTWTDEKTPEPNDGKAFFGRDSMANLFIIASKQFGTELFEVSGGTARLNINEAVFRKIWDTYYVPYIGGCYYSYGRFRSDDAKVGDILAYVGATSSAAYFPTEVTYAGQTHSVVAKVLPVPLFEGAENVMVQQGAGMVVTQAEPEEEYASVVFLKWFTEARQNTEFSALSGYLPVKKEAADLNAMTEWLDDGEKVHELTAETLKTALSGIQSGTLYTNKAFAGGVAARAVLDRSLQDKAAADREAVLSQIASGKSRADAVAALNTDEAFAAWLADITQQLNQAAG